MSVINKMLQDLDKRQQGHGLKPGVAPVLQYTSPARSKMSPFLGGIASALLGAALLWGWQSLSPGTTSVEPETLEPTAHQQQQLSTGTPDAVETEPEESNPIGVNSDEANSVEPESSEVKPSAEQTAPSSYVAKASTEAVSGAPSKEPTLEPALEAEAVEPTLVKPETVTVASAPLEPVSVASVPEDSAPGLQITEVRLTPSQLAAKRLAKAEEAERQGSLAEAEGLYLEALRLDGGAHQARRQLAALFYGQGRLPQAAQLLEQGSLAYPQESELLLLLAKVQRAQGLTEVALATLDRLPGSGTLALDKWVLIGEFAQAQHDFSRAEAAYRQLIRLEPAQPRWWMGLGFALDSRAQYPDAVRAYKMALSLSGLSMDARTYIENRLLQLGRVDVTGQTGERE